MTAQQSEGVRPDQYCTHYACRCARAAELAAMGRTFEAVQVHDQEVRCRLPHRSTP